MSELSWFYVFALLWGALLLLGLVALTRCRREDIPTVLRELRSWFRK